MAVLALLVPAALVAAVWPNLCANGTTAYSATRCPSSATCCSAPYSKSKMGCCPWENAVCCPNNPYTCCPEGTTCTQNGVGAHAVTTCVKENAPDVAGKSVCKPGPELPFNTSMPNIVILGDSVSIGYTPVVAKIMAAEAMVQHSPWDVVDGGAEETAYGLQCLDFFTASSSGTTLVPDILMFNFGLHDGPLGNESIPGDAGLPDVYKSELTQIATQLKQQLPNTTILFALTSAYVCNAVNNGCVQNLNNQAAEVMAALDIPTLDMYTPIANKCGPLPNDECMGVSNCFCPHCPGVGYEFIANTTVVPKLRSLLKQRAESDGPK